MSQHHLRLLHNILAVFSSTLVSRVLKFLLFIYAARSFGPEDYGRFSYVMVFALLSVIAVDLGVSRYLVQQLSKDPAPTSRYLGQNLLLNWVLGILVTAGICSYFALFDSRPDMALLAALLVGGSVLETLAGCYHAIFQSQQKMVVHSFLIAAGSTTAMLAGFLVLFATESLPAFAAIHTLAGGLNLCLSWMLARKRGIRAELTPNMVLLSRLVRHGLPFSLTAAFIFIYYHIDSLFLEHYQGSAVVGYYNAAYRLVEVPLVFLSSITLALFPALSHLDTHDRTALQSTTQEALKLAILFSLPGSLAICLEAASVTGLIYGEAFRQTADALAILILSVAVIFPNAMLGTLLRGVGRQKATMWVTAAGAALNCGLNYLFIPSYGLVAAAATTLATECFIGATYWRLARREVPLTLPLKWLALTLTANAAMLLILWLCAPFMPLLPRFACAGAAYLLFLHVTGLFPLHRFTQLRIK